MKKTIIYSALLLFVAAVYFSCSKKVDGRTDFAPILAPAKTDIDAGN